MLDPPKCPQCGGAIEHIDEHKTISYFFANMIGAEIFMYIAAGVFFVIGLQWYPALIISIFLAVWLFFIKGKNVFICKACGEQFKYGELYKRKNS